MTATFSIGPIAPTEIGSAVRIFLDAFAANVRQVYGVDPRPDAMLDVWSFAREAEPQTFLAARADASLLGYALFTSSVKRLQRRALTSGAVLRWALRALSGRYGILWRSLGRQLWNKMLFVRGASDFRSQGDAQLLNIAVAPAARGRGVAKALLAAGLRSLGQQGVPEVRLEVLPDNAAAIAAYRDCGFRERGRTRNVYGDWLVMTVDPREIVAHD